MRYLLTGKQMLGADQYTINEIGIPSMVLMERAAIKTIEIMEEEYVDFTHVLVVCGSGNNGGDGYAIARLLHLKGYKVSIYFAGDETKRSKENDLQRKIAEYYKIPVKQELENEEYSVIIDAIFGIGLSRSIEGRYQEIIEKLNEMNGFKVAIDLPSGIHDETGKVMGAAFRADLTVAIAFAKQGQIMEAGNPYVGTLRIADIGVYIDAVPTDEEIAYCYELDDFMERFPKRNPNAHKGAFGKILLIVGSYGMSGAAYLCAKAAYAAGAGLVQIYTHEDNRIILQEMLPEAIISTYSEYDEEQLQTLLAWADVIGIGCGLGMTELADQLVKYTIRNAEVPCVVDADALNLIAQDMTILSGREHQLVLTPHMKEMARLLGCEIQELQEHKIDYFRAFVKQYGVTCVLKDARTLVKSKEENMFLNLTGSCAIAKGGSGDVLAGLIAGIIGQNANLYEAACLGVYLHGKAGDFAREKKSQYSVLAGDIIDNIGDVLEQV